MAQIRFIRKYKLYNYDWYEIIYAGTNRIRTIMLDGNTKLPSTAVKFLEGKQGVEQYDRIFNRQETIYK